MKNLMFILISCLYFNLFGQTSTIQGHITEGSRGSGFGMVNLTLLNTSYKAITDLDGNFKFSNIPAGSYDMKLSFPGLKDSLLAVIAEDGITVILEFTYPYCMFNALEKTCPVCKRKDQVIPILYGYPSKGALRSEKRGKLRLGGCQISHCDPSHYCKRDQKEF
jgi:CarboxypepD_reg-like domain